jgi:hypothetical protein
MEEDSSSRGASILEGELEVLSAQLASHRRMNTKPAEAITSSQVTESFACSTLLHRVQRERGATAAWLACGGSEQYFGDMVVALRAQTDASISARPALIDVLQRLRSIVDHECSSSARSGQQITEPMTEEAAARLAQTFYSTFRAYVSVVDGLIDSERVRYRAELGSMADVAIAFTLVKENVALQRGFVTGMLALPHVAVRFVPPRAFADLVICLQQQRVHRATVDASAPRQLRDALGARRSALTRLIWLLFKRGWRSTLTLARCARR